MYKNQIRYGMAQIVWGLSWADHVEEHGCANLSGIEITSVMPEIPEEVYLFCERVLGMYQALNGREEQSLLWMALEADGINPETLPKNKYNEYEERFGECLAFMALGHGVSWFDDHKEFDLKIPDVEASEFMILAEEQCEYTIVE